MPQKRIEFIDALRGMAILLVVFMHVPQYGFHEEVGGMYMTMAKMLAVPLFFFISGYLTSCKIAPPEFGKTYKRFRTILVPTLIAGCFYAAVCHMDLGRMLLDKFKGGYWFTVALFEFYLIYDGVKLISKGKTRLFFMMLGLTAVACYALALPSVQRLYEHQTIALLSGVAQWKYFLFFVLGIFVRKHADVIHSERCGAVIILTFLFVYGGNVALEPRFDGLLFNANLLLQETSIVLMAYIMFYKYQAFFSERTAIGRFLRHIGVLTLEIYLLHYFVLPRHLDDFAQAMSLSANPLIAAFVTLLIVLLVISVVMMAIHLLQSNVYLKRWIWNK